MKQGFLGIVFAILMTFTIAGGVWADEAKPADDTTAVTPTAVTPAATTPAAATPAAVGTTLDDIKKFLGMSVYVQGGYTYNFKNPDSQQNDLRIFDHEANSFTLDLAELVFTKDAPVGGVGYKLKLSYGETAKFIHSAGLGNANDEFDLTEAYVDYVAPVGTGLKFLFGKFVTYNGAEVIEARDNPNYSRSFLFNYAIPFTNTGLMVGYTFSSALNANLYLMNGWDNAIDNNKGKTGGVSIGLTPIEQIAMTFNLTYGPEQTNNTSNDRFLFDWVGTIKPVKDLSLILNTDYATEKNDPNANGMDSKWYGIAGILKYDFSDYFSMSARGEYFDDKDGARTGTAQKLKEITITPEFRVAKSVIVRPEFRHDWSDQDSFDVVSGVGTTKHQDTIALGVMYTW
jgi:hypothetical protein